MCLEHLSVPRHVLDSAHFIPTAALWWELHPKAKGKEATCAKSPNQLHDQLRTETQVRVVPGPGSSHPLQPWKCSQDQLIHSPHFIEREGE